MRTLSIRILFVMSLTWIPMAGAQQTAAPVFSPGAGTYPAGQMVTISDATPGATIYYGEHGVIPTTRGKKYTGPFVPTGSYETVIAMAVAPGMSQSAMTTAKFVLTPPPAATPVFVQPPGNYPGGQKITITCSTPGASIYIGVHGVVPTTHGVRYSGPFSVNGVETVQALAVAPGYSQSAIATAKYVAQPTSATPVFSPPGGAFNGLPDVVITGAAPGGIIYYTTDGSTPTQNSLRYSTPIRISNDETLTAVQYQSYYFPSPAAVATYQLTTPAPTFTPAGGSDLSSYTVSILDYQPSASIYYTTDGSTPTHASTLYTGPIQVTKAETVKAIAALTGYADSVVASASFTISQFPTFTISTIAGTGIIGNSGDGGPATEARLYNPNRVVLDKAGNIYFSDGGNSTVRKITVATGVISRFAGTTSGYSGDGGPATEAQLTFPKGLAFDSKGNLYISDPGNGYIRKVDTSGMISTYAGAPNTYNNDPTGGVPARSFEFGQLEGITFDANDNLFVADTGHCRVLKIDGKTQILTAVAGNGICGVPTQSHYVGQYALQSVLQGPADLAFDAAGKLYIADASVGQIDQVDLTTETLTDYAGHWETGYTGDGGPAFRATLAVPQGIAFDSHGNLFIGDTGNDLIREVFLDSGNIYTIAGDYPKQEYSGDGGPATQAGLFFPTGIAFDASGDVIFVDSANEVIRKLTPVQPGSSAAKP